MGAVDEHKDPEQGRAGGDHPHADDGTGDVDGAGGASADIAAGGPSTGPGPLDGAGGGPPDTAPTDGVGTDRGGPERTRFDRMRKSTAGVMMTGIAIGLQEALELPRQQPAFVIKASGEPDGPPGPIDLHFDPDDPTKTVAVIRPPAAERDGPSA